jgi:hypothetical protein
VQSYLSMKYAVWNRAISEILLAFFYEALPVRRELFFDDRCSVGAVVADTALDAFVETDLAMNGTLLMRVRY